MLDNMFHDVVEPSVRVGSQRRYTVPASIAAHVLVIAIVIVVPLVATDVLPAPPSMLAFVVVPPVPLPAPPPAPSRTVERPVSVDSHPERPPSEVPDAIRPERVAVGGVDPTMVGVIEAIPDGVTGAILDGAGISPVVPPSAPPAIPRVRPGGNISPPVKIKDVRPVYPAVARAAHIEGIVIIEATIGTAGTVEAAKVLRSVPLLDEAALDAVRQWVFTPTLLNGTPVAVVMTVTVKFTLN